MTNTDRFDPRSEPAKKLNEYPYFTAKPVSRRDDPSECCVCVVGVFQHDVDGTETQIGSYERNYRFMRTFCWFRRGARHFALYSRDYTAARVMEIIPGSGTADLGGEEPDGGGFCPVEFYVPDCREHKSQEFSGLGERIANWADPLASHPVGCEFRKEAGTHRGTAKLRGTDGRYIQKETSRKTIDGVEKVFTAPVWGEQQDYESGWIKYPPDHGFVYGCVWGWPYQIQYLDLSRVEEGIIQRDERFGYIDLPTGVLLRDAVHVDYEKGKVSLALDTRWDLHQGRLESPELCSVHGHELHRDA